MRDHDRRMPYYIAQSILDGLELYFDAALSLTEKLHDFLEANESLLDDEEREDIARRCLVLSEMLEGAVRAATDEE